MAKVTITVEGEHHEIRRALRRILGPLAEGGDKGGRGGRCGGGDGGEGRRGRWRERKAEMMSAMEGRTPWTEEEIKQLWGEVTAGARLVLGEIAKRPEGYPNAELQAALGMPGNAIGGTLSSVGTVWRKFGEKPPVYWVKFENYRMPPRVAQMINKLSADQQSGKGG